MQLESKDEMKKRGITSPDRADALALSCFEKKTSSIGSGFADAVKGDSSNIWNF